MNQDEVETFRKLFDKFAAPLVKRIEALEVAVPQSPSDWHAGYREGMRDAKNIRETFGTPQTPQRLTEDQIMAAIRKVTTGELREMLTCKRWKNGIDIDHPTFAAERLAEEFRAAVADTRPLRQGE